MSQISIQMQLPAPHTWDRLWFAGIYQPLDEPPLRRVSSGHIRHLPHVHRLRGEPRIPHNIGVTVELLSLLLQAGRNLLPVEGEVLVLTEGARLHEDDRRGGRACCWCRERQMPQHVGVHGFCNRGGVAGRDPVITSLIRKTYDTTI